MGGRTPERLHKAISSSQGEFLPTLSTFVLVLVRPLQVP